MARDNYYTNIAYAPMNKIAFLQLRPPSTVLWRVVVCTVALSLAVGWLFRNASRSGRDLRMEVEAPIFNTTLGFQKILVLNVPSRTDLADWVRLSAAASDLHVDFIDGVDGDAVLDKVLPYPPHRDLGKGNVGSWRAHMNAMAYIVANNISTALILEDDADWDIRIKHQMRDFSRATRALTQPLLRGTQDDYADPTFLLPRPHKGQPRHEFGEDDQHIDFSTNSPPRTAPPRDSPYGDNWDVLWPGHCAMHFPRSQDPIPKGRYVILNDETVMARDDMKSADSKVWPRGYPDRSRIVHHVYDPICTYAYAVSQRGARKILWEYGIKLFDRAFDNLMSDFCDMNTCLSVQPQLFSAFAAPGPVNRDSEINGFGQDKSTEVREKGRSENIQKSVRLNLEAILYGASVDELEDQYPVHQHVR